VSESHASSRDDFEASSALDSLVERLQRTPGVLGATHWSRVPGVRGSADRALLRSAPELEVCALQVPTKYIDMRARRRKHSDRELRGRVTKPRPDCPRVETVEWWIGDFP
jgi:hypothetical protein